MKSWGFSTYTHDLSHKYGKLGPRGTKSMFVRYFETFKGYMFIGKHENKRLLNMNHVMSRYQGLLTEKK